MTARPTHKTEIKKNARSPARVFPFTAIVGQEEMKLALLLNVVAPNVGGVLVMGERGTGKSTAVRALADLLPPLEAVRGCPYHCDPKNADAACDECRALVDNGGRVAREKIPVPVVELPLGATEDRVCGTIDVESVLRDGVRAFEPGLLARANRGFLYIDEVNLLEDHLVDLLLDASVTGSNKVEREGVSLEHPARFVLVGSGNPEEGELRPQLLDRFGLSVEVRTAAGVDERVEIVERRERFDADPARFLGEFEKEQDALRRRLTRARRLFDSVEVPRALLRQIAELCARLGVDGHRGELTVTRASRALAALEGRRRANASDVRRVAALALGHRMRRDPLEQASGGSRIREGVEELFGEAEPDATRVEADSASASQRRSQPRADDPRGGVSGEGSQGGNASSDERDEKGSKPGGDVQSAPPAQASLPPDTLKREPGRGLKLSPPSHRPHGRARSGDSTRGARGRYNGATREPTGGALALDAMVRAAAFRVSAAREDGRKNNLRLSAEDLRYKRLRGKSGTLYIFAVDTSGSMALNRIGQAKGAVAELLRKSYVNRDRVALVSFRERGATVLLHPSAAPARARRALDALPVGGATPLASGLLCALEVARGAKAKGAGRVRLLVFTDGRANVPLSASVGRDRAAVRAQVLSEVRRLGAALAREGVASFVVDTGSRFTSGGEGAELASALGGRYVQLPNSGALPTT